VRARAGAFISTCAVQLGIVGPHVLYLNHRAVFTELEIWRLLTNLVFFGGFGMPFVFSMFFLVRYSAQLEEGKFAGRSADYAVCLVLCASLLTAATALVDGLPFLAPALLSSVVYLWARLNPTQPLSIFGLFTVQAFYFPWVLVAMTVLMGGSPLPNILGIVAGHVYHFLTDVQGIRLTAPRFLCARWAERVDGRGGVGTTRAPLCTARITLAQPPAAARARAPRADPRAAARRWTTCGAHPRPRTAATLAGTIGVAAIV